MNAAQFMIEWAQSPDDLQKITDMNVLAARLEKMGCDPGDEDFLTSCTSMDQIIRWVQPEPNGPQAVEALVPKYQGNPWSYPPLGVAPRYSGARFILKWVSDNPYRATIKSPSALQAAMKRYHVPDTEQKRIMGFRSMAELIIWLVRQGDDGIAAVHVLLEGYKSPNHVWPLH